MAILTNSIDSYTEIYSGGGNWLTQSYPTNFHTFVKRKMLTQEESVSDYMEVTDARKTALEQSDAAWARPEQAFIDEWNAVDPSAGWYNESTGFFELNGLTDITYEQAVAIMAYKDVAYSSYSYSYIPEMTNVRTLFPILMDRAGGNSTFHCMRNYSIEVIVFKAKSNQPYECAIRIFNNTFWIDANLKTIRNLWAAYDSSFTSNVFNASQLENLELYNLNASISLGVCKYLTLDSLEFIVRNRHNGRFAHDGTIDSQKDIIITLHVEVYTKLTKELIELAANNRITFASA